MSETRIEKGWVIESGAPPVSYWDGRAPDTFHYDHFEAIRFARRCDAERLLAWGVVKPPAGEVRIAEHQWGFGLPTLEDR